MSLTRVTQCPWGDACACLDVLDEVQQGALHILHAVIQALKAAARGGAREHGECM